MREFRTALSEFRDAVRREGEQCEVPTFQTMLRREQVVQNRRFSVAAVAIVILGLGTLLMYRNVQRRNQDAAAQSKADALLLEQVNTGLSRSVSRAMQPLMEFKR